MDENQFEMAERLTARAMEEALHRTRAAAAPQMHPGFDGRHCVECDDAIPPARLQLGRVRCVPCQSLLERRA